MLSTIAHLKSKKTSPYSATTIVIQFPGLPLSTSVPNLNLESGSIKINRFAAELYRIISIFFYKALLVSVCLPW